MNAENNQGIQSLEKVLADQLEAYEAYARLVKEDEENMAHLRLDKLEHNNKLKATILLKIQIMDEARQNLVKQVAERFNLPKDKVRIADICRAIGGPVSHRLTELRTRLHTVINSLQDLQERTTLLANTSLSWINSSVNTLKGLLTPTGTYNTRGHIDKPGMFAGRTVEKQA